MNRNQEIKLRYSIGQKPNDIARDMSVSPYLVHKTVKHIKKQVKELNEGIKL